MLKTSNITRGSVYLVDLNPVIGSEQGGLRPVLVIQNNIGNKYSPTVIVAAITSKKDRTNIPTHVKIPAEKLEKDSIVLLEQIRTIDKRRLKCKITELDKSTMDHIDEVLKISLGIDLTPGKLREFSI